MRPIMVTDDRFTRATPHVQVLDERGRAQCCRRSRARDGSPVTQGFVGATADGRPDHARPRRLRLHGHAARCGARCRAGGDLDRRERAHDGRPAHRASAPGRSRAASYEEAAELATFGAKVLHPATAQPLVRAGIPIVVLNSTRPNEPGTVDRALGRAGADGRLAGPLDLVQARDHGRSTSGRRACSAPTASCARCSRSSSGTRWWWTCSRAAR